ncbi:MAG: response regulator transcription factor [Synergistaceae bacterium]|jgi:two-component system KDP operon response regulator KdpE|nr:response regulator transcription factor [Synergistaceae bacterium]
MSLKDRILIVEDENSIRHFIETVLVSNNYEAIVARTGTEAYSMITSRCPDLVLLDLGLPDMDGLAIIKMVREWSQLPIVVVSARMHERDKVAALDMGADDYMTKPFGPSELLARIRTALRHAKGGDTRSDVAQTGRYQVADLVIDYDKHQVFVSDANVRLTQNEYKIVALLGRHAGKVITYDYLLKAIWGPGLEGNNQILRVNMANIRRKIEKNPAEPEYIFTEAGVGYRLREEE